MSSINKTQTPEQSEPQPETITPSPETKPAVSEESKPDLVPPQTQKPKEVSQERDRDQVIKVDSLAPPPLMDQKMYQELISFYEQSLKEIKEGDIVRGRVVSISDKEIAVDIGFKAEGTISLDEFDNLEALHIGDEIYVFLDKVEDQEGQLVLSKRKADFMKTWDKMVKNYEEANVIKGHITRRIKGGMVVDLNGIDAFLPGSQIDIHPVRDFDALVGMDMDFRIVKINELRKNIVLSHKVLIEESLAEVREKILLEMDIGAVMEGIVKNITDFGVFVDLGGVDGLLHITDLSWGRINHPSEVVKLDEKIKVKIIDFDPVRKRVSIGYKQLQPHPWDGVEARYPIGTRVIGKVVSITNYGAFIELEKGVEGLIHVSEMSWTQHIKHPSTLLSIGDEVEAAVLSMDVAERKISLGMKQIEPDPWETLETKYSVGSRHKGVVQDLVPFGAFVELEDGIEGLIHISDLSWTRKVRHPGEIVKKGQEIEVVILGFDRNERRIALGHKQIHESPWDSFETQYAVGTLTRGKLVRLIDKGVIVELPHDVEGFVPNSQLGRDQEGSIRKRLNVGDELDLVVVEFEKDAKRIVLSATEARKLKEKAEYQEYVKAQEQIEIPPETGEKVAEPPSAEIPPPVTESQPPADLKVEEKPPEVTEPKPKKRPPSPKTAEAKKQPSKPKPPAAKAKKVSPPKSTAEPPASEIAAPPPAEPPAPAPDNTDTPPSKEKKAKKKKTDAGEKETAEQGK